MLNHKTYIRVSVVNKYNTKDNGIARGIRGLFSMDECIDSSWKNVYPPCEICVVTAMITNIADIFSSKSYGITLAATLPTSTDVLFMYYVMCDNRKKIHVLKNCK